MYLFLCNKSPQHLVVKHNNSHLLSLTVSQSSGSGLEYLMRLQSCYFEGFTGARGFTSRVAHSLSW